MKTNEVEALKNTVVPTFMKTITKFSISIWLPLAKNGSKISTGINNFTEFPSFVDSLCIGQNELIYNKHNWNLNQFTVIYIIFNSNLRLFVHYWLHQFTLPFCNVIQRIVTSVTSIQLSRWLSPLHGKLIEF